MVLNFYKTLRSGLSFKSLFFLFLLSLFSFSFSSCNNDRHKELVKKWQMEGEDVILEFKNDSTFLFSENTKAQQGSWSMKNDTIILRGTDSTVKSNFAIKKLTKQKLTLEGSGEVMDFAALDSASAAKTKPASEEE